MWFDQITVRCGTYCVKDGTENRCLVFTAWTGKGYVPLQLAGEERKLFLRFAALDPKNENEIVAFAREFGLLGSRHSVWVVDENGVEQLGEPVHEWEREITEMRCAVDLWQAMTSEPARLKQWITIEDTGNGHWVGRYRREDLPLPISEIVQDSRRQLAVSPRRHDALAQIQLERFVNERLSDHTEGQLLSGFPEPRSRFRIKAKTLLGALWVQLAQAISGTVVYRKCGWRECSKWIEISREQTGRTSRAKYCDDPRHRVYEHRAQKRDAARHRRTGPAKSKKGRHRGAGNHRRARGERTSSRRAAT